MPKNSKNGKRSRRRMKGGMDTRSTHSTTIQSLEQRMAVFEYRLSDLERISRGAGGASGASRPLPPSPSKDFKDDWEKSQLRPVVERGGILEANDSRDSNFLVSRKSRVQDSGGPSGRWTEHYIQHIGSGKTYSEKNQFER